jgi:hypothetical protein
MIIEKNKYYPTLKSIFAFKIHQCDKCENYFKFEYIWRAMVKVNDNLVETFLCGGCANTKEKATKYFIDKLK